MMGLFFIYILCVLFSERNGIRFVHTLPSGSRPCEKNDFPCNNGNCVKQNEWCDLEDDCGDSTDEMYCQIPASNETYTCPSHFFQCDDGSSCIPEVGLCNGFVSCDDRSDELDCNSTSLLPLDATHKMLSDRSESEVPEPTLLTVLSKSDSSLTKRTVSKNIVNSPTPNPVYARFTELRTEFYHHQREMALHFLVTQRKDDFGWGDETPRALMALLMSSVSANYEMTDVHMLMAKQLDVKLSIALARNETKPIKLTDLALYINAILSTCRNPKNFYGYDLVNTLRQRVNNEQQATPSGHFVSPSVYLTLCINDVTTHRDVEKLQDLSSRTIHTNRIGIQALALLATSCITKFSKYADHDLQIRLIQKLLIKIKHEGLPRNVYEISLLIQALNEARVNELEWHRAEAINFLLKRQTSSGSFGDILATYYVLPILSGRSVLSLDEHCSHFNESDLMPVEVLENTRREKIDVQYSLYHGHPVDLTLTMQLHVAQGTNFLDIMRLAQERSLNYRFKLDDRRLHPLVYSIGGIPNDAERGMFWVLHVISNRTRYFPDTERLVPNYDNIKTLFPEEGDEMVFWMKPI